MVNRDIGVDPDEATLPFGEQVDSADEGRRERQTLAYVDMGRGDFLGLLDDLCAETTDERQVLAVAQAAIAFVTDYAIHEVLSAPSRRLESLVPTRTAPPRRLFSGLLADRGMLHSVTHPANGNLRHELAETIHADILSSNSGGVVLDNCHEAATELTRIFATTPALDEISEEDRTASRAAVRTLMPLRNFLVAGNSLRQIDLEAAPPLGPATNAVCELYAERFH